MNENYSPIKYFKIEQYFYINYNFIICINLHKFNSAILFLFVNKNINF